MTRLQISTRRHRKTGKTSPGLRRRCVLRVEPLETRWAPAVVSWTGAGDGVNWGDPHNWSTGMLPGLNDNVFINTDPGTTIQYTGGTNSIQTLQSQNALNITGGSLTIAASSAVNNTLFLSGGLATFTLYGSLNVVDLVQTAGTFTGAGTVTISDQWTWTQGTMSGVGHTVLAPSGQATLSGGFFSMLDAGRTVDNFGSAFIANNDAIYVAHSAVWNNQVGSYFILGDGASVRNFFAESGSFNNRGVLALFTSSTPSNIDIPLVNQGVVDVEAGSLFVNAGGSSTGDFSLAAGTVLGIHSDNYTLQPGATVVGAGTVDVPTFNTLTVLGNLNMQNLSISGGAVLANQILTLRNLTQNGGMLTGPGTVTINDQWTWTGGRMTGPGRTVLNGAATLSGGATLDGRTVDNNGTVTAMGSGFSFSNDAVWNNQAQGTVILQDQAGLGNFFAGRAQFVNAGLLEKLGTGAATIGIPVVNTGSLYINNTSTLQISGNYTQGASGSLQIDIGGTTAGTDYGQLKVNGTAALDGNLTVNLVNDFMPSPGDQYQILTFGSRGNPPSDFNSMDLPDGLTAVYDARSLTLVDNPASLSGIWASISDDGESQLVQGIVDQAAPKVRDLAESAAHVRDLAFLPGENDPLGLARSGILGS